MNNKFISVVLFFVVAAIGFLAYGQVQLQKKVDGLLAKQQDVSITPATTNTSATEASPFNKNYTNQLTDQSSILNTPTTLTQIKFDKTVHNFGKINEGEVVKTVFKFKNSGDSPLVISTALGSCGCTVPHWPRTAIQPGETGEIGVEFDSNHKSGEQNKTVTVTANTSPPTTVLTIQSTVIPKDK